MILFQDKLFFCGLEQRALYLQKHYMLIAYTVCDDTLVSKSNIQTESIWNLKDTITILLVIDICDILSVLFFINVHEMISISDFVYMTF